MSRPRRNITTLGFTLALWWTSAVAALALPGEGFGLEPFGVPPTTPTGTPTTTTTAASAGFDPSLAQAIIAVALVGLLLGIVGYLIGAGRQHRVVAH